MSRTTDKRSTSNRIAAANDALNSMHKFLARIQAPSWRRLCTPRSGCADLLHWEPPDQARGHDVSRCEEKEREKACKCIGTPLDVHRRVGTNFGLNGNGTSSTSAEATGGIQLAIAEA